MYKIKASLNIIQGLYLHFIFLINNVINTVNLKCVLFHLLKYNEPFKYFKFLFLGTMNGVVQTCGYMFMFAVIKIYPMMVSILGILEIWTIFTIMCMISVFFCSFILPETKGVTLDVILTYFEPQKKNKGTILPKQVFYVKAESFLFLCMISQYTYLV